MEPVAFGEVLDELVGRYPSEEPAAGNGWHPGIGTRPLFPFEGATALGNTPPRNAAPKSTTVRPPVVRPAPRRPARMLSAQEREALDLLNSLGAELTADLTRGELRSAFRALARRFHPDANPTVSGREFARIKSAYDALK